MPIPDFATYKEKILNPFQRIQDTKISLTTVAGRFSSLWLTLPDGGAAPSTAEVPTRATAGAIGQQNSDGVQRLAQVACSLQQSGYMMICDRLSHQGGLNATITDPQTTNLPTAALTRYTTGAGVFMAAEIYTTIGSTGTTVTVSYTNQAGVGGRTSVETLIGATGYRIAGQLIVLPLQNGDTGVRSVESVTLAGSTLTAGNFGITLYKPLLVMPIYNLGAQQFLFDSVLNLAGNMPQIINDACLWYTAITFTTTTGIWLSANRFIEE